MSTKSVAISLALAACLVSCKAFQDGAAGTRKSNADPVEAMSQAEKAAAIGPEHEKLAALAGNWNLKYRYRNGPSDNWHESNGTASAELVLDGRFLLEKIQTTWDGKPYKGVRIHGYDNIAGEYFNIWLDTVGTWPVYSHGTKDSNGVLRYIGRWKDIHTPGGRPFRTIARQTGDDTWVLEMYDTIDDKEEKVIEATYTRRK